MNTVKNLNSDIIRYNIPHCCNQCVWCNDCADCKFYQANLNCKNFIPCNMDDFLNNMILYLKINIPNASQKLLSRKCSYHGATNDKVTALDEYYVAFINDCIKELRKGKGAYIFNLHQLYDIIRFYSDITAKYQGDGVIGLFSNEKCNKK